MITSLSGMDFYAWVQAQAAPLRVQEWTGLDIDLLVVEIEGLRKIERKAMLGHLGALSVAAAEVGLASEPIQPVVAPLSVQVMAFQLVIGCLAHQHMKVTDQHGVEHRYDGAFLSVAGRLGAGGGAGGSVRRQPSRSE
jgi:hypothetical protein